MKLKVEIIKVAISLLWSIFGFLLICIWRIFDTRTFLFTQVVVVTALIMILSYFITYSSYRFKFPSLVGNELLSAIMVFVVLSSCLINIDRSRSIFILKWISVADATGISSTDLVAKYQKSNISSSAISQRIQEQKQIGNVSEHKNKLRLTLRGKIVVTIARFFSIVGNLKGYKDA